MESKPTIEHRFDIWRGVELRDGPKETTMSAHRPFAERVSRCGIKRSKRRIAMMLYLTSGWTPWGVQFDRANDYSISLCGRIYIMRCGHVMGEKEAQAFVDAGLLMDGPKDRFSRPTLVITDAGKEWLNQNW